MADDHDVIVQLRISPNALVVLTTVLLEAEMKFGLDGRIHPVRAAVAACGLGAGARALPGSAISLIDGAGRSSLPGQPRTGWLRTSAEFKPELPITPPTLNRHV
jgi:hypothetical protein